MDMIGPWTINAMNGKFILNALTMIDSIMGWFRIKDVNDFSASIISGSFMMFGSHDIPISRFLVLMKRMSIGVTAADACHLYVVK